MGVSVPGAFDLEEVERRNHCDRRISRELTPFTYYDRRISREFEPFTDLYMTNHIDNTENV